ncbi:hypothetical protein PYCCODRAFT_827685 [Trametes coccinea BRFM310]|uniref:Uncharacterized protein n=1 Tax=Trametes coccinea (strain BRFM310) TaxID=1353009 RepID=A0A1Y2IFS2_TRAC3|nr:hypothetical protein PYCCODRAFT_827685 [Trametes coccinea BRFM310]
MHHHASLTANLPSLSLASLFQAAAGRAWARTRPTRAYHRTSVRSEGVAPISLRAVHPGYGDAGGVGESSSSAPSASYAVHPSVHGDCSRVAAPIPHSSALPRSAEQVDDPSTSSQAQPREANARPAFTHRPKRSLATNLDVETLKPQEFETPHHLDSGPLAYQSDPPWEDIRDSVPETLLPQIYVRPLPVLKQQPMIPNPSTPEDLVTHLTDAIMASPPASLGHLLSYHAAHPSLHSTESFNLLIKVAIRHSSYGTVRDLLSRMVREDVPGDVETRTLRVRCLVRTGYWTRAWGEEMARMRRDGEAMPLPVWLEFFGEVKRGAIWVKPTTRWNGQKSTPCVLQPPDSSVIAERLDALLNHQPLVRPADLERVPPRVVYAIVRAFIARDQRSAATQVTADYFATLPHELDEEWRWSCLSIVHLHLKPRRRTLAEHYALCKTLFGFLDMHPSLRPTSTTLFFLLGSLKGTRRPGTRADAVVRGFVKHWGPDIVDDAVRRRVASYWLRQREVGRAESVSEVQAAVDEQRVEWRAEKEAMTGLTRQDRERRRRWLDLNRSPRKNKQRFFWRLLRRRLWRAKVRRSQ